METYASEINETIQKHGRCILPGIGLLEIIYHPAERSSRDNTLDPPSFEITLSPAYNREERIGSIINQIAVTHALTKEEAAKRWESAFNAIKEKLSTGSSVPLEGLGWFNLNEEGRISFVSSVQTSLFYSSVPLKPSHEAIQNETEHTSSAAQANIPAVSVQESVSEEDKIIPLTHKQSRARWWIIGSIVALLIIGWFTYQGTKMRREKKATIKEIITQTPKENPTVLLDSMKQSIDSMEAVRKKANDSIHYKIIFATYDNKNKAEHQFHKLKGWGHPVELIIKDSTHYELAWPYTSLPIDTIVNLVKMMKLYGENVHIEYNNK